MDIQTLIALAGFAVVTSITPGPNNLMLLASGANFGLRRTVPHMFGISLGHGFMVFCVGAGLAGLFAALPWLQIALKGLAVAYMLWLAWKIATASAIQQGAARGKPFTFLQAAGFQWVNPKAWAMALGAISAYSDGSLIGAAMVAGTFILCNLPSVSVWAIAGTQIARVLSNPRHLRVFNIVMALLLLACLAVILA